MVVVVLIGLIIVIGMGVVIFGLGNLFGGIFYFEIDVFVLLGLI